MAGIIGCQPSGGSSREPPQEIPLLFPELAGRPARSQTEPDRTAPSEASAGSNNPVPAAETTQSAPPAPLLQNPPPPPPIVILQTRFDILRIRVPRGVFSQSAKVWNHVEEEAIPAATAMLLQRNGLRVGLGTPDSWPPIHALLELEKNVEMSSSSMILTNGLPLTISVDQQRPRDQTLFLHRADGTMAGVTCPMSRNLIRIEYQISIDMPTAIELEIMPEIRQQPVRGGLAINELGQLDQPLHEPARVLRELAFRVVVEPENFVILGPSPAVWPSNPAARSYLAGSLLLCETIDGKQFESMYFITPRQERSDRRAVP